MRSLISWILSVSVSGNKASSFGKAIDLGADYGNPDGDLLLGIRPENVRLTSEGGLPVQINRVRDVGRHKLVNASMEGTEINVLVDASDEIETGMSNIAFDRKNISVFRNEWRIEPTGAGNVPDGAT